MQIGNRTIGDGPPMTIAELGMNHNGDLELAHRLVAAAADAGADAVKFQSFRTDRFLSPDIPDHEERRAYELPISAFLELARHAKDRGILAFSTPLDAESADELATTGVPCFKLASCDLTNTPLIEHVARYGRPTIMSTGFSTLDEISTAVEAFRRTGNDALILMHCVAVYPTPLELSDVHSLATLREAFDRPVGLSDHSIGVTAATAATALGAAIIEKHFTLDRSLPGYDHAMSETPESFAAVVTAVHEMHTALGDGRLARSEVEQERTATARRSLYWRRDLNAGHVVTSDDIDMLRPGHGMPPAKAIDVQGRTLTCDVQSFKPVRPNDVG